VDLPLLIVPRAASQDLRAWPDQLQTCQLDVSGVSARIWQAALLAIAPVTVAATCYMLVPLTANGEAPIVKHRRCNTPRHKLNEKTKRDSARSF